MLQMLPKTATVPDEASAREATDHFHHIGQVAVRAASATISVGLHFPVWQPGRLRTESMQSVQT